jgi:site-specific recombinase XerD
MAGDGGWRYSANTLRAQKADGAIFQAFCESRGEPYLPADPKTIRAFIEDRTAAGKKPATIKRYVATIARVHVAAGLLKQKDVRLQRARTRRILWAGKRSRSLSRAPARGCAPTERARCFASHMRRLRDGANWWHLK